MPVEVVTAAENSGPCVEHLGQIKARLGIDAGHRDLRSIHDQVVPLKEIRQRATQRKSIRDIDVGPSIPNLPQRLDAQPHLLQLIPQRSLHSIPKDRPADDPVPFPVVPAVSQRGVAAQLGVVTYEKVQVGKEVVKLSVTPDRDHPFGIGVSIFESDPISVAIPASEPLDIGRLTISCPCGGEVV